MRMLHEVHRSERLLQRGRYQYLISGQTGGYFEEFVITRLPNGQEVTRSEVNGLETHGGRLLLIHLVREPDGKPAWLRMRYGDGVLDSAAQYTFKKANIRIARQRHGYPVRQEVVDIATNYEVDYHAVIGMDYVWRGYPPTGMGEDLAIPVFSPDLWAEADDRMTGRSFRYHVHPRGYEDCVIPAGRFEHAQTYEIMLSDGVRVEAWYDEMGLPLRWYYPDKGYDFMLETLERRA